MSAWVGSCTCVTVVVAVRTGGAAAQSDFSIVLSSSVTAPLRARSRPSTEAPEFSPIDVRARIVPLKIVVVPSVAELPTCQKTLHGWAPLSSRTRLRRP